MASGSVGFSPLLPAKSPTGVRAAAGTKDDGKDAIAALRALPASRDLYDGDRPRTTLIRLPQVADPPPARRRDLQQDNALAGQEVYADAEAGVTSELPKGVEEQSVAPFVGGLEHRRKARLLRADDGRVGADC